MKKLINSPENIVLESITGLGAAFSDLIKVQPNPNYITRADAPVKNKVALVSGGGSGHEPLHGGFVGRGMLDAACPGEGFTSPVPDQMLAATKAVDAGAGGAAGSRDWGGDARGDPVGPGAKRWGARVGVRQRHGRDTSDRAVPP